LSLKNTMSKLVLSALLLVLLAACTHKHIVQSATQNSTYAVTQNMQRQVQNARDVGDGDFALRQLREKLVKNPNDLDARLEIADHFKRSGSVDLAIENYRLASERFPDNARSTLPLRLK
jgi:Tfp pilus assembly protein PilF